MLVCEVMLNTKRLGSTINEMDTAVCVDDVAQLSYFEAKGSIFEGLLHLSALEEAQIAACPRRRAVPGDTRDGLISLSIMLCLTVRRRGDTHEWTLASDANLSLLESCLSSSLNLLSCSIASSLDRVMLACSLKDLR